MAGGISLRRFTRCWLVAAAGTIVLAVPCLWLRCFAFTRPAPGMATTQITAEPAVPQLVITSEFAAPRHLLFRAYTDPELLTQWLEPRGLTMTIDHLDPCHGGTWRCIGSDADGSKYSFHGVFHGAPSPDRIVQTIEVEDTPGHVCLQTISFTEREGRPR